MCHFPLSVHRDLNVDEHISARISAQELEMSNGLPFHELCNFKC